MLQNSCGALLAVHEQRPALEHPQNAEPSQGARALASLARQILELANAVLRKAHLESGQFFHARQATAQRRRGNAPRRGVLVAQMERCFRSVMRCTTTPLIVGGMSRGIACVSWREIVITEY